MPRVQRSELQEFLRRTEASQRLQGRGRLRCCRVALAQGIARGNRPAPDAVLDDMIANDRNLLAYQIAEVYAWRGETDKAFEWLQISYDNHDTGLLSLLIDPLMRGLRSDPRYEIMVEKVGLPTPL
jgi:hypothetical protein